jgi:hypothetical protein
MRKIIITIAIALSMAVAGFAGWTTAHGCAAPSSGYSAPQPCG